MQYQMNRPREWGLIALLCLAFIFTCIYVQKHNPNILINKPLFDSKNEKSQPLVIPSVPYLRKIATLKNSNLKLAQPFYSQDQFDYQLDALRVPRKFRKSNDASMESLSLADRPINWIFAGDAHYFVSKEKVIKASTENQVLWQFQLQKSEEWSARILVFENVLFATTKEGHIYALSTDSGQMLWTHYSRNSWLQGPYLRDGKLLFIKSMGPKEGVAFVWVDPKNGQIKKQGKTIKVQPSGPITIVKNKSLCFLGDSKGQLHLFNFTTGKRLWSYQGEAEYRQPVLVRDNTAYAVDESGVISSFVLTKKQPLWTHKLKAPPASPMTFIPLYNYVAIHTTGGYLQVIKKVDGSGVWKFKTRNDSEFLGLLPVQATNRVISDAEMSWGKQGWVIWSPCVNDRICIFDPKDGQIIGRIWVRGQLISFPAFENSTKFFAAIYPGTGDKLEQKWTLATYEKYESRSKAKSESSETSR